MDNHLWEKESQYSKDKLIMRIKNMKRLKRSECTKEDLIKRIRSRKLKDVKWDMSNQGYSHDELVKRIKCRAKLVESDGANSKANLEERIRKPLVVFRETLAI